ncbi:MAG: glycosyltransferase family 4 protein [Gemmatimonadaceae bacterium]
MNIAIVCHVYPPEHAPAGVMMAELAEDLVKRGHRVTVITGWPSHPAGVLFPGWTLRWRSVEDDLRGFRIARCRHSVHPRNRTIWRLWYYFTFGVSAAIIALGAGPFDAVLCLSTPIFGGWATWMMARLKSARFIYGIFDLHPEAAANANLLHRGWLYRALRRSDTLLCRASDSIVTLSEGLRLEILDRGIAATKVTIVPFWLDGAKIKPGTRNNAWRRQQAIAESTFVVLYAGTIGHISGAEMLIETARSLESFPQILILCVGDGPIKDRLIAETKRANLANLRFLPFQPAEVLSDVQSTADVGLVTLLPDAGKTSVPSKVLGYLAAGRPVVASVSSSSDTAKTILRAECGRVTKSQDAVALTVAILELADHPELCRDLGRRARNYFEHHFDRGPCISMYERVLSKDEMTEH